MHKNGIPTRAIEEFLVVADGHEIWNPDAILRMGFPQRVVDLATRKHTSGFTGPTDTVFDGAGRPVRTMTGVASLDLLYVIAREMGADPTNPYMGRGSQARHVKEVIRKALVTCQECGNTNGG